jgi:dihydroxy-acid dehydratase
VGNASEKARRFRGKARVSWGQAEPIQTLARREMLPGTWAVFRGPGPKGGPGVALASSFVRELAASQDQVVEALKADLRLRGFS